MNLYLVRHGHAGDPVPQDAAGDERRPLTDEGRDKTREVARGLRELDCVPDRIFTSPLLRAAETAKILASVLAPKLQPEPLEFLQPGGSFARFMKWLDEIETGRLMAVGHMPDLGEFAQRCLTGREAFRMEFKKAAVCCLSFDGEPAAGHAQLEWLMQPAALRRMAR